MSIPAKFLKCPTQGSTWLGLSQNKNQGSIFSQQNKYAIHAYTHGPVTGSGSSVVLVLSLVVASAPGLGS